MNELPDFISEYKALFQAIKKIVPPSMKIYLVGGAVRDILLGRKIRDFDFSVEGLVRPIGKHIANELNGAYYVLDDEREMVRVIIGDEVMGQYDVDIALMTGDDIEDDLRDRDFTFNAMAIELGETPKLVDPLGGKSDLDHKVLKMCSPDSLKNDPLRALRAIRMSLEFNLEMDDELVEAMKSISGHMDESSLERYRDEIFKIVRLNRNAEVLQICDQYGLLYHLFPNRDAVCDEENIRWIENVDLLTYVLTTRNSEEHPSGTEFLSYASGRLGNYKPALCGFFDKTLALYHSRRMHLSYAAIAGSLSSDIEQIKKWSMRLAFSSTETNFVILSIQAFDFLKTLPNSFTYSDVDIYRYFRKYKEGGISGLILYLAEKYSEQEIPDAYTHWCDHVVFAQSFIAAYFSRYLEVIAPKPLMSGDDIQKLLNIPAGPEIGYAKNALIEAQIKGSVKTVSEAEPFLRQLIKTRQK